LTSTVDRRPGHAEAPPVGELLAITDPVGRALAAGRVARDHGTLPAELAEVRRDAVLEALRGGMPVTELADRLGLTPSRIYAIASEYRRDAILAAFAAGLSVAAVAAIGATTSERVWSLAGMSATGEVAS